jgi:hypothetical protein
MAIRTNGGVFDQQILTGRLSHWIVSGSDGSNIDFSGAINSYGQPVPFSAAEIIFKNIEAGATINIMNPSDQNLSFALEEGRSIWDEISLTAMVQSLGSDVGVDHVDCSICEVKQVPYIWGSGTSAGGAGYIPVTPGSLLDFDHQYFVTSSGTVTLPQGTGSGRLAGTSVTVTKPNNAIIFINTTGISDIISTDLGNTNSIEVDITQESIFVFDGINKWNYQTG